jgi:hypothetical protein
VDLYLSYRATDDTTGFAFSISRELKRVAAGIALTDGRMPPGGRPPDAPRGAVILALIGSRWSKPAPDRPSFFTDRADAIRRLLESALEEGQTIAPVLCGMRLVDWPDLCASLPPTLRPLEHRNALELRHEHFNQDLQALIAGLQAPRTSSTWAENEGRTLIRVETETGGPFKWWSNRTVSLRVLVDGNEVGGMAAWNGRLDAVVAPGRHTVQLRQGPLAKTAPVTIDVPNGAIVSLVCGRNSFTGGISLARKG